MTSKTLKIGQVLRIRVPNNDTVIEECYGASYTPPNIDNTPNGTTYIVKKGDSLYSLAKKYNTTVDSIKKKNNLKSNALSIGQKIII